MKVMISRLHFPVTVLGPGRRAGIWLQGCSIGCPGCVSRDTWDPRGGAPMAVDEVLSWIADRSEQDRELDGITITGGEPTEQPEALFALAAGIDRLRRRGVFTGDVLCFTGRVETEFAAACPWAAQFIDAVITGTFRITQPTELLWRGSANQRLIPLTERGRERYEPFGQATAERPELQVTVADGQVWMIGIPRRGDLQQLEAALRRQGVALQEVSWRPR